MNYIDEKYVESIFKTRRTDAHKGNFGKVLIFAGSVGMAGAAILCGRAALQSGAGLVQFLLPSPDDPIYPILQTVVPEATCVFYKPGMDFSSYTSIAAGSGLGKSEERLFILKDIINRYGNDASNFSMSQSTVSSSSDSQKKKVLILDADALNLIAEDDLKHINNDVSKCIATDISKSDCLGSNIDPEQKNINHESNPSSPHHISITNSVECEGLTDAVINSKAEIIITPHIGEAKRLLHTCEGIKSIEERKLAASALAEKYNCIAVLKGAGTLVCCKNSMGVSSHLSDNLLKHNNTEYATASFMAANENMATQAVCDNKIIPDEYYIDKINTDVCKSNKCNSNVNIIGDNSVDKKSAPAFTICQNTTGIPGMATAGSGDTLNVNIIDKNSVDKKITPIFTVFQNTTGNPGMATAGSGDTLTGIIASLAGQGYSSFEAACLGVYFHGEAGDMAAESISQMGITAGDIAHFLPYTFKLV